MASGKMALGRFDPNATVIFGETTKFDGVLRFSQALCIRGRFIGTIESGGDLIVDAGAVVEADVVNVRSLSVRGKLTATVRAEDKVDFFAGSEIKGNITAGRIRIADGVLFEGRCNMVKAQNDVEIFSRPIDEIKSELMGAGSRE